MESILSEIWTCILLLPEGVLVLAYGILIAVREPSVRWYMLTSLVEPTVLTSWAIATGLVVAASRVQSIGSLRTRYWWGVLFTVLATFGAMLVNGEMHVPITGDTDSYAGLRAAGGMALCLWAGLILGGPTQVLIAKFHLFGQSADSPRGPRVIGCGRKHSQQKARRSYAYMPAVLFTFGENTTHSTRRLQCRYEQSPQHISSRVTVRSGSSRVWHCP